MFGIEKQHLKMIVENDIKQILFEHIFYTCLVPALMNTLFPEIHFEMCVIRLIMCDKWLELQMKSYKDFFGHANIWGWNRFRIWNIIISFFIFKNSISIILYNICIYFDCFMIDSHIYVLSYHVPCVYFICRITGSWLYQLSVSFSQSKDVFF